MSLEMCDFIYSHSLMKVSVFMAQQGNVSTCNYWEKKKMGGERKGIKDEGRLVLFLLCGAPWVVQYKRSCSLRMTSYCRVLLKASHFHTPCLSLPCSFHLSLFPPSICLYSYDSHSVLLFILPQLHQLHPFPPSMHPCVIPSKHPWLLQHSSVLLALWLQV